MNAPIAGYLVELCADLHAAPLPNPNGSTTRATSISTISPSILRTIVCPARPYSRRRFEPVNAPIGGYLVDIQANMSAVPPTPPLHTSATSTSAISPSILRTIIFPERPHSRRQFLPMKAPIGGYLVDILANMPAVPPPDGHHTLYLSHLAPVCTDE
jgi:hypothetical protein